ncbi:MAG: glycosyltransferase family 2 protein [Novosphingobium sp.]
MAEHSPGADETITVVMPVYNALPYLHEAIAGILAQTHRSLVLAIYDDHSTDGSHEVALDWAKRDPRITVVRGERRLGPCASSNAAAALAATELVARMDADDIARPERLARELAVLRDNPDAVLVGSTFDMIDAQGRLLRRATPGRILGHAPPFAHPSIMYRRRDFDAVGGYQPNTDYFEDLGLYERLAQRGRLLVTARPLVSIRFAGQHPRLRDNRQKVLRKIDRQFHYRDSDASNPKVSVAAYYSVAVLSILALERPRMFGEILRRASFINPWRDMSALAIVGIAEISPRLARFLGQSIALLRERINVRALGPGEVFEWKRC